MVWERIMADRQPALQLRGDEWVSPTIPMRAGSLPIVEEAGNILGYAAAPHAMHHAREYENLPSECKREREGGN